MKNLRHKNLQSKLENLIPILELWIALLEETKKTQTNLEELPAHLEYLQEQLKIFELKNHPTFTNHQQKSSGEKISQEIDAKL